MPSRASEYPRGREAQAAGLTSPRPSRPPRCTSARPRRGRSSSDLAALAGLHLDRTCARPLTAGEATTRLRTLADDVVGAEKGTIIYERQLERATTKTALSKESIFPRHYALGNLRFCGLTRGRERPNDQL